MRIKAEGGGGEGHGVNSGDLSELVPACYPRVAELGSVSPANMYLLRQVWGRERQVAAGCGSGVGWAFLGRVVRACHNANVSLPTAPLGLSDFCSIHVRRQLLRLLQAITRAIPSDKTRITNPPHAPRPH